MPHRVSLFLVCCLLSLLQISLQAKPTATGTWEFDSTQKELYVNSIKAQQANASMSEIAVSMGLATMQNSIFQLGQDANDVPYLKVIDKATNKVESESFEVVSKDKENGVLTCRKLQSSAMFRLKKVDDDHIVLEDMDKRVTIPLRRLS